MKYKLLLAIRYLSFYKVRSAILVACVALTLLLPISIEMLVRHYQRSLMARAGETPLVVGAKGSRFDLVLSTLYFKTRVTEKLTMAEVRRVRKSGLGTPIPVYARYSAEGFPIVGTTLDYFDLRRLKVKKGALPGVLGEVVVGSAVAEALNLKVGDKLRSDYEKMYDISATYPLLMKVAGILAESRSADDRAVLCDVKTTWVIEGIGHGHMKALDADADSKVILKKTKGSVAFSEAVEKYFEITPENIGGFHFHGDQSKFPLTGMIVVANDAKSATILKARYGVSDSAQMVRPVAVVTELMDIVFRAKRFFDANFVMVCVSTVLFFVLVIMLSLRIRKRERETLYKIGCSRATVFVMQAIEVALVVLISLGAAAGLASGLFMYVVRRGYVL